jgi:hypothetical protein
MVRAMTSLMLAASLVPAPAFAWGTAAHRLVMSRAIDELPSDIRPFFDANREELVLRVNDPDLWRVVGWDEDANHFLDFGVDEYGPYPFTALPRDYDRAVERFGSELVKEYGLLPWRFAEMFGELRRAFQGVAASTPFASSNVVLFAAAAAHYIQDAHQPLHATINYDGQQTGQRGLHARFETQLFERFGPRLALKPASRPPMDGPRDAAFDVLLESYRLVPELLDADKTAAGARATYDNRYYDEFFREARPLLERRLSESVAVTAAMITGAWVEAGRPQLRVPARVGQSR